MPPLIGITTSLIPAKGPRAEQATLGSGYIRSIEAAGGIPILLPPYLGERATETLLSRIDGLLLTGGGDVDPRRYGESPEATVMGVSEERDTFEITALRSAMDRKLPLFCICRGMQILNVALGGSLIQDVPSAVESAHRHAQEAERNSVTHAVTLEANSKIARVLRKTALEVNSMHHQSVKAPGSHVVVTGRASDGVVEAIELTNYANWMVGVQWHPEELAAWQPEAKTLFRSFIESA